MDAELLQPSTGENLRTLLTIAWLLPLAGFCIEVLAGFWSTRVSKAAAYMAVACIGIGFLCSTTALIYWGQQTGWVALESEDHHAAADRHHDDDGHDSAAHGHDDSDEHHEDGHEHAADHAHGEDHEHADAHAEHAHGEHEDGEHGHAEAGHGPAHVESSRAKVQTRFSGSFYTLALFGNLKLSLDYYIDSLTLVMFTMVTLIATCIHVFAIGYMSDELTDDHVDHEVHLSGGGHLHRPGRFYKFFSYMSLFCFSMLGLVIAGNVFQVFIFWELVGICSYLLIGFYVERKSASTAANKAFIVNRVGDFGFLIGMMVIWTWFGTFHFTEHEVHVNGPMQPGLFEMVRGNDGQLDIDEETGNVYMRNADGSRIIDRETQQPRSIPYFLLVVAGVGVFAGCIGKSAQFPLQTWLPDAMEGPTPVSALVHSATMVAAGVYLAGRFYPVFTPEVLLVIAYIGCITLFVAATIAVVATDIKRVLAYSTISQLGYMMLAIGVAGWAAGLFHLITHAFFKSLMFLCSGSVIVGCHHEQEMPRMGGLLKKMPITALTMLVGVVAICGLGIPGTIFALSGFHSKDAIVATAYSHSLLNPTHFLLFLIPLITAGITAFYMFRLWFYTFWGEPRDQELHDHVRESPSVMTVPLLILALFAAGVAWGGEHGVLYLLLSHSEPAGVAAGLEQSATSPVALPSKDFIHGHVDAAGQIIPADAGAVSPHAQAGLYALLVALVGTLVAYVLYGARLLDPGEIKRQFAGVHGFLVNKWRFDELYEALFVQPVHVIARWCTTIDRIVIDGILHKVCAVTIDVSRWDRIFDEKIIDGMVNLVGNATFNIGRSLRVVQTGRIRQYIMFLAVGVLTLFVLMFVTFPQN